MFFLDFSLRLLLALFLGACIGVERSLRKRMAGLKTNSLVAMGAALFVMYALSVTGESSPTRVAAQVVSGIGFLGAGVILRDGWNIRGLTTAATIWCSAAIGVLCGSGHYLNAIFAALTIVCANIIFKKVEDRFHLNMDQNTLRLPYEYKIVVTFTSIHFQAVKSLIVKLLEVKGFQLKSMHKEVLEDEQTNTLLLEVLAKKTSQESLASIIKQIALDEKIEQISWQESEAGDIST